MEDQDNQHLISQHDIHGVQSAQVPSTLFSIVLHRLRLTAEQTTTALSFDDIAASLQSDNWEIRVAAVRSLEHQHSALSKQLLLSTLNDEDGSVRAAAVHVLGRSGPEVPLHPLIAALHDDDWHVRETAVFALGKQGQRVPQKVLIKTLADADEAVKEAARIVLHQRVLEEKTFGAFGVLWEQNIMKDEKEVHALSNGTEKQPSSETFETVPYYGVNDADTNHENHENVVANMERPHPVREQEQMYVPSEYGSEQYAQWEKVTSFSPRRGPHKAWWGVTAAVAVLCFLFGGLTMTVLPSPAQFAKSVMVKSGQSGVGGQIISKPTQFSIFMNPQYASIAQDDIASALHLSVGQIQTQLDSGNSLTAIAQAQGISATAMQGIEMQALTHLLNAAVQAGDIQQPDANQLTKMLQSNPPLLDKVVFSVFEANSAVPVQPTMPASQGN